MLPKQRIKLVVLTLSVLLLLSLSEPALALEGREGGKNQTPVMIVVQVTLTAIILRFIEPWIMP